VGSGTGAEAAPSITSFPQVMAHMPRMPALH